IAHYCKLRKANAVDELGCSFKVVRMVHKEQHLLQVQPAKGGRNLWRMFKEIERVHYEGLGRFETSVVEGEGIQRFLR
ncbi:hypothetical protein MKW92_036387, partial [Papaver armeniacum]